MVEEGKWYKNRDTYYHIYCIIGGDIFREVKPYADTTEIDYNLIDDIFKGKSL